MDAEDENGEGPSDAAPGEGGRAAVAPRPRRQSRRQGAPSAEGPDPQGGSADGEAARDPFEVSETIRTLSPFVSSSDNEDAPATVASFDFVSLPDAGSQGASAFEPTALGAVAAPAISDLEDIGVGDTSGIAQRVAEEVARKAGLLADGPLPISGLGASPVPEISLLERSPTDIPERGGSVTTTVADMPPHAEDSDELPTAALGDPLAAAQKAARAAQGEAVDFYMGGYHVHRRLGQGGMAVVFLARPDGGREDVVLKRIRPSLVQEERYVKLFMREARIASSLDHPNVVRILDHAEEEGEYYIVMEFLDGIDLRDLADRSWAQQQSLPLEPVLGCLVGAARGLDYAHHKQSLQGVPEGLVHRDVSPENLFVTRSGVTKVLDFGIAKGNQHVEKLTRTGEVKGKVPYLAPEQILGKKLDGRCDLFALGVTAYWLLTGVRPFDGTSNFMTIKKIIEEDPKPVTLLNPFIPDAVDAVVMKALAKERKRRFARCADFADALEALLAQLPEGCDEVLPVLERSMSAPRPTFEPYMSGPVTKPTVDWD